MALDLPPTEASQSHQRRLLQIWLSPSFPVGAFAYSHGLERAVEAGLVADRDDLRGWLADLFARGSIRNDLVLLTAAWRAARSQDWDALGKISELATALQPSAERRLESLSQGGSFVDAIEAAWPVERDSGLIRSSPVTYPVAVAIAAAAHGIALDATLEAYATAFIGSQTSAAIRLSLIGQTDAQRITAALLPAIAAAARHAETATLDDLGAACLSADLCSMEHETQYTRLFRS